MSSCSSLERETRSSMRNMTNTAGTSASAKMIAVDSTMSLSIGELSNCVSDWLIGWFIRRIAKRPASPAELAPVRFASARRRALLRAFRYATEDVQPVIVQLFPP